MRRRRLGIDRVGLGMLVIVGGFSVLFSLYRMGSEGSRLARPDAPWAAHERSVSAIGHAGLVEVLRLAGHRVVSSTADPSRTPSAAKMTILAEPRPDALQMRSRGGDGPHLVVLPKRRGRAGPRQLRIREAEFHDLRAPQDVLAELDLRGARVLRVEEPGRWNIAGVPAIASPQVLDLPRSSSWQPVISCEKGVLLARNDGWPDILVLSDPDLIQNHRVLDPAVAAWVVRTLERFCDPDDRRPIVFDGSVHGFTRNRDIWVELLSDPLQVVSIHLLLVAGIAVTAGLLRFGPPRREPRPERGRGLIVTRIAALLQRHGRARATVREYASSVRAEIASACHQPRGLEPEQAAAWLARLEERRRVSARWQEIEAALRGERTEGGAVAADALNTARAIHRWREEMLDESR